MRGYRQERLKGNSTAHLQWLNGGRRRYRAKMDPDLLNDLLGYTLKLQVVTDFPFNQYGCSLLIPFGIPQKVVFKTLREIHFRQPVFLSG